MVKNIIKVLLILDDGTMIVVEEGRDYIGKRIDVLVTSVLQTSAGRMIFAKPKLLKKHCRLNQKECGSMTYQVIIPAAGQGKEWERGKINYFSNSMGYQCLSIL